MMTGTIELLARREGDRTLLLSPAVGLFTLAEREGRVLTPGDAAGSLHSLGVSRTLLVPSGATGRVISRRPERVFEPVGFAALLYELAPVERFSASDGEGASEEAGDGDALLVLAPHGGRFWHGPAPSQPPFVSPGDVIESGRPIGLIEVMKTFSHVHYEASKTLPLRARIVRFLPADGTEVRAGEPLLEVAPS